MLEPPCHDSSRGSLGDNDEASSDDSTTSTGDDNSMIMILTRRTQAGVVDAAVLQPPAETIIITARSCAIQALAISVQNWEDLGQGEDPSIAAPDSLEVCAERITAMLFARLVAVNAQPGDFKDFSTTTLCRTCLVQEERMETIPPDVLLNLHSYVRKALAAHKKIPFHNYQHTYHVVLSANKLIDMILRLPDSDHEGKVPPTFGLRCDPIALLAIIFSALIRDIGHHGVTNRQLIKEGSKRALLYNDQSVHEHRALHMAFRELVKDQYSALRKIMFPQETDYRYFRSTVVSSVLSTDLASPERSQISKSKWKEAFGEDVVPEPEIVARRSSMASNISMPRAATLRSSSRRDSMNSVVSDVTIDSQVKMRSRRQVDQYNMRQRQARRMSSHSVQSDFSDIVQDSIQLPRRRVPHRRASTQSMESNYSDFAADSVAMVQKRMGGIKMRSGSLDDSGSNGHSESTFQSLFANSVNLAQKRKDGQAVSRMRQIAPAESDDEMVLDDYYDNIDDDASLSLTPPSSDDEYDGVVISGITLTNRSIEIDDPESSPRRGVHRRASTGNLSTRFRPLTGTRIDEEKAHDSKSQDMQAASTHTISYQKRLGIRRSMDLSGESIEMYSRQSIGTKASLADENRVAQDEPDELKLNVMVELILRVAQSSHGLQSWENFVKWSSSLFRELMRAHSMDRGHDPRASWFDNQVRITESYLLPLVYKIEDSGVFGADFEFFSQLVNDNREKWLVEGVGITHELCSSVSNS